MSSRPGLAAIAAGLLAASCRADAPRPTDRPDAATPGPPAATGSAAAPETEDAAPEEAIDPVCDPWVRQARTTGIATTLPGDFAGARRQCQWRIEDAVSTTPEAPRVTGSSDAEQLVQLLRAQGEDVKRCRPSEPRAGSDASSELARELRRRIRFRAWFDEAGHLEELAFQTATFGHGLADKSTHICLATLLSRHLQTSPASKGATVTYTYRFEP